MENLKSARRHEQRLPGFLVLAFFSLTFILEKIDMKIKCCEQKQMFKSFKSFKSFKNAIKCKNVFRQNKTFDRKFFTKFHEYKASLAVAGIATIYVGQQLAHVMVYT